MSTIEKIMAGFTAVAIVTTVFTSRTSPQIISNLFGGIAGVYKTTMGH